MPINRPLSSFGNLTPKVQEPATLELPNYNATNNIRRLDSFEQQPIVKLAKIPEKQIEDIGLIKSLLRGVVSPYAKAAATIESTWNKITPQQEELVEIDLGYFGKYKPVENIRQAIGVGAEITADWIPVGKAVKVGKQLLGGAIKQGIKTGVKTGLKAGGLVGAGLALQEEEVLTFEQYAYRTGTSALLGGTAGLVLGGAVPVIGKAIKGTAKFFNTPELQNKLTDLYTKQLKMPTSMLMKEDKWGKNTPQFLSELASEGRYTKFNKSNNKLDTTDAVESLKEWQLDAVDKMKTYLQGTYKFVNVEDYKTKVVKDVSSWFENKGQPDLALKIGNKVSEQVDILKQQWGDLIPIAKFNEYKSGRWDLANIRGREQKLVLSNMYFQMGHTAKDMIEGMVDDFKIKDLNKRIGDFAEAVLILNKRNGVSLGGGWVGRRLGATLGFMTSNSFSGKIAGMIAGNKIAEIAQDPRISTWFLTKLMKNASKQGKDDIVQKVQKIIQMRELDRAGIKLLAESIPYGQSGSVIPLPAWENKNTTKVVEETWQEFFAKRGINTEELVIDNDFKKLSNFEQDLIMKKDKPMSSLTGADWEKNEANKTNFAKETQILRGTKGMTADDIMTKYPDIKLKRDVPATDIYGNKVEIPNKEVLTPYELKGNKVLLQDGQTYLVSKSQFQNIKGQSVSKEVSEFAPELKGTEETVKGMEGKMTSSQATQKLFGDTPYRELSAEQQAKVVKYLRENTGSATNATKYSSYQLPDGKNYKEILIKSPTSKGAVDSSGTVIMGYNKGDIFKSSHWDEPNVISHIRMNERTYQGKKVAFMEELQSDWAREGRSKGFTQEITKDTAKQQGFTISKTKDTTGGESYFIDNPTDQYHYRKGFGNTGFDTEAQAWNSIVEKLKQTSGAVPQNPLLKNWQELSVKRALKDAVDSNAEYFSWINGEQTSARYNLATHLEKVGWEKPSYFAKDQYKNAIKVLNLEPKTGNIIEVYLDKNGKVLNEAGQGWKGKKLDEVLGKGLADKIMEKESGTLSGEGLKFGGEWANNLYDKQVGNIVSDLTGAKVENLDLGLPIEVRREQFFTVYNTDRINKPNQLKVGLEIYNAKEKDAKYIITDILGDGKFKAVPKNRLLKGTGTAPDGKITINGEKLNYHTDETQTFDISTKKTTQQGIKLTPEIKAKIRGEAPKFSASGKQFEVAKPKISLDKK